MVKNIDQLFSLCISCQNSGVVLENSNLGSTFGNLYSLDVIYEEYCSFFPILYGKFLFK